MNSLGTNEQVLGLGGTAAEIAGDLKKARHCAPLRTDGPDITAAEIFQLAEDGLLNGATPLGTEKTWHNGEAVIWLARPIQEEWSPVTSSEDKQSYTLSTEEAAVIEALRRGGWTSTT